MKTLLEDINQLNILLEESDTDYVKANEYADKVCDIERKMKDVVDDTEKLSNDKIEATTIATAEVPIKGVSSSNGVANLLSGAAEDAISRLMIKFSNSDVGDITSSMFNDEIKQQLSKLNISPNNNEIADYKVNTGIVKQNAKQSTTSGKKSLGLFSRIKSYIVSNKNKMKNMNKADKRNLLVKIAAVSTTAAVLFAINKNKNKIMKKIMSAIDKLPDNMKMLNASKDIGDSSLNDILEECRFDKIQ